MVGEMEEQRARIGREEDEGHPGQMQGRSEQFWALGYAVK